MKSVKRKWDVLSEERRREAIKDVISFFYNERGEEIGVIAAQEVLDLFLKEVGPDIYRKGVEDSKALLKQRLEDLEVDLDVLSEDKRGKKKDETLR